MATDAPTDDCPLPPATQTRNLLLFGGCWCLVYLSAPVSYVGVTQAAVCKKLETSDTLANLPLSIYMVMNALPFLIVWFFSKVRALRPVLVTSFLSMAIAGALVAAALLSPYPELAVPAIVLHGAVLGLALGAYQTFTWEVLGRGVASRRRGQALSLAFGFGPVFAFAGSVGSQRIIDGSLHFPWNYAVLFGATAPIMALAAFFASRFVVPLPAVEAPREPLFRDLADGLGRFFGYSLIRRTIIAYLFVFAGYMVVANVGIYTKEATDKIPADYAGLIAQLRFACKGVVGFALGWLVARTHAKVGLLATTGITLAGIVWALFVTGDAYFLVFAFFGAGELFGVYFPNYLLGCSQKSKVRRNLAYITIVSLPIGFVPVAYGAISDSYGLPASFQLAAAAVAVSLGLIVILLPNEPVPREADADESDRSLTHTAP